MRQEQLMTEDGRTQAEEIAVRLRLARWKDAQLRA